MKKIILTITLLLVLTLSACDTNKTIECDDNQVKVDGVCVDKETYNPRSLVPEECAFLDTVDDWQPVWCEEFDYEGLPDSEKWFYDVGGSGWGNNELQYYTKEDLDNASVSDGTLKITALLESMGGKNYTSARLVSKYRGDWLYGKFEIRAKVPSGNGTWSAAWMLPTQYEYGAWPRSGEIDIMEHVGYDPDKIHGTIHTGAYNHNLNTQIGYTKTVPDASTEFHTYTLIWEPHFMEIFVDGDSYGRFGYNPLMNVGTENSDAWPFDQEFHMILNLAIGGMWGGVKGVDDSLFPHTLEVDYVRVYQKDYQGMDKEAPSVPENITLLDTTASTIQFKWDHSEDDVMVKEYLVLVNDVPVGATTLNAYTIKDLEQDTQYKIDVQAVDFKNQASEPISVTFSTESLPQIGRIEAESYDYQEGVVREETNDTDGDKHVTWLNTNDFMEYQLYVPETGTYKVTYRVASEKQGEIKLYGKSVLPLSTTIVPNSGSYDIWINVESDTFDLTEGIITFRVRVTGDGFNLNYFTFTKIE